MGCYCWSDCDGDHADGWRLDSKIKQVEEVEEVTKKEGILRVSLVFENAESHSSALTIRTGNTLQICALPFYDVASPLASGTFLNQDSKLPSMSSDKP